MPHTFISTWKKAPLKAPPYLFPGDDVLLQAKYRNKITILKSFSEYCRSDQIAGSGNKLHLGLLPLPYWGDLQHAKVFLLMLNPGLSHINYYSEYQIPSCRGILVRNIKQRNFDNTYPSIFLNPRYCWDGGFRYWTDKLASVAKALMFDRHYTYQKALSILSRRLACIQLVPYHSRSFQAGPLVPKLISASLAQAFIHEDLLPKARKGKIQIIVLRGNSFWKLQEENHVIVYRNWESRGSSLSLDSRGGKSIHAILSPS
jgi:hypothetical protein